MIIDMDTSTHYPLLLIHGLFGFDKIGGYDYFYGIKDALTRAGAKVFSFSIPAINNNEVRGQALLERIDQILNGGADGRGEKFDKVNLIGHSQGPLAARYAAALHPEKVASVTSVACPNQGSEIADLVVKALVAGTFPEAFVTNLFKALGTFISLIGGNQHTVDPTAAFQSLTSKEMETFNRNYPQGLPGVWGGEGKEREDNGVYYYSWSGIVQADKSWQLLDPGHSSCVLLSKFFSREKDANDGAVGRFSSHLGKVIRSDYPMDHFDIVNQFAGIVNKEVNPVNLYLEHAVRLKSKGL